VLGKGEDIAVGVFEPGDPGGTVGSGPDAVGVLLQEGIALEDDPGGGELLHGGSYVWNLPAQDGVGCGVEGLHAGDADVGCAGANGDGEGVIGDEGESEGVDVEAA